jgi:hypothetical protein
MTVDGRAGIETTSAIFRPELPKRVLWVVVTLMFGLPVVGLLSDPVPSDAAWWFFLVMCVAIAGVAARSLFIRVVADEHDVTLVNIFSSHQYAWDSIARFEVSPRSRSALLVTKTGKRRRLAHLQVSPTEDYLRRSNHTQDVVDALQRLLREARPTNG